MNIYVLRHGVTESNINKKLIQRIDESMNETGFNQVLKVKQDFSNINFEICFSSPYKRTLQTAEILAKGKCSIITDDRLKERDFGFLEEGSKDCKYTFDFWNYYLNRKDYKVEPLQNLFERTKLFLDYLKENYEDKNILIISHAATIRALHYNLVGFDKNTNMLEFSVNNAEILHYTL